MPRKVHPISTRLSNQQLALKNACLNHQIEQIYKLLDNNPDLNPNFNIFSCMNITLVHEACWQGRVEVLHALLDYDVTASLKQLDSSGHTPLMNTIIGAYSNNHHRCYQCAETLLNKTKVNPNQYSLLYNNYFTQEQTHKTAIHLAVEKGYPDFVDLLIQNGADINTKKIIKHDNYQYQASLLTVAAKIKNHSSTHETIYNELVNLGAKEHEYYKNTQSHCLIQ